VDVTEKEMKIFYETSPGVSADGTKEQPIIARQEGGKKSIRGAMSVGSRSDSGAWKIREKKKSRGRGKKKEDLRQRDNCVRKRRKNRIHQESKRSGKSPKRGPDCGRVQKGKDSEGGGKRDY